MRRIAFAFLAGALFSWLLGDYLRAASETPPASAVSARTSASNAAAQAGVPARAPAGALATRLSYELARPPDDQDAPLAKAMLAKSEGPPLVPQPDRNEHEHLPPSKVANARPIYATPPEPRDTTREMEKEGRGPISHKPALTTSEPIAPRYVEGRDLVIAPKAAERASAGTPAVSDDIERRLAVTREWLASSPPGTHTLQLMGAQNEAQLKEHLQTLSQMLDPGKIHLFRTVAQGKPSMTVVYGAHPDRESALAALQKLPQSLSANRPVLRTVKGIRHEIAQQKPDP